MDIKWTAEEDKILLEKFPILSGGQLTAYLPGRSRNAIIGRYHRLTAKCPEKRKGHDYKNERSNYRNPHIAQVKRKPVVPRTEDSVLSVPKQGGFVKRSILTGAPIARKAPIVGVLALVNRKPDKPLPPSQAVLSEDHQPKLLFDLNSGECRFAFDNPDKTSPFSFVFCAKPSPGKVYCEDHQYLGVRRSTR